MKKKNSEYNLIPYISLNCNIIFFIKDETMPIYILKEKPGLFFQIPPDAMLEIGRKYFYTIINIKRSSVNVIQFNVMVDE